MKNRLYSVLYTDQFGHNCKKLFVSTPQRASRDAKKAIREESQEKDPLILKHNWVSGFYIQPMSDSLENIVKDLEQRAIENYPDTNAKIGYLEALRDVLSKANESWEELDLKRRARASERLTGTLGSDSNVPVGYDNEGNRK